MVHSQTEAQMGMYEGNEERGVTGRPQNTPTQRCVCRLSCRFILRSSLFGYVPNGASTIRVAEILTMNQVVKILPSYLVIQNNQRFKETDNPFFITFSLSQMKGHQLKHLNTKWFR